MRKSKTVGGDPCFILKVEMVVYYGAICTALADYAFEKRGFDLNGRGKKYVKEILVKQLRLHGQNGQWEAFSGDGNGLGDEGQAEWNSYYEEAEKWVEKNYPCLKTQF
jgi:hypothetical protein